MTYKDIVILMLSSALPKNALGVCADPKGQVSLTPHTHPNLTPIAHTYNPCTIHHHHHTVKDRTAGHRGQGG